MIYASKSREGFFDPNIHGVIPEDAVEISDELHKELRDGQSGKRINFKTDSGIPVLVDIEVLPLTTEQVEQYRVIAYSDNVTGSDKFFSEVVRLTAMGRTEKEIDVVRQKGIARYEEIRLQYPLPAQ